jgi:hypothetical protein
MECGRECTQSLNELPGGGGAITDTTLIECQQCSSVSFCWTCVKLRCEDLVEAFGSVNNSGTTQLWQRDSGVHITKKFSGNMDISSRAINHLKHKYKGCLSCTVKHLESGGGGLYRGLLGLKQGGYLPNGKRPPSGLPFAVENLKNRWAHQLSELPNVTRMTKCRICKKVRKRQVGTKHCTIAPCKKSMLGFPWD